MDLDLLDPARAAALARRPFTYPEVGASDGLPDRVPEGYVAFSRSRRLARRDFEGATEDLLRWQVQRRAGLRVQSSTPRIERDTVVEMRLGVGPAALRIPCRVVSVVDEADRQAFAYGTLPGHPETGEEVFVLTRDPEGALDADRQRLLPARHAADPARRAGRPPPPGGDGRSLPARPRPLIHPTSTTSALRASRRPPR